VNIAEYDRALWAEGICFSGIDEAGLGLPCVTGVASCVVMPPDPLIAGIDDSKKCTEARRETLYAQILERAVFCGVGEASVEEIDELNILQATLLAMRRAAHGAPCGLFVVDGNRAPDLPGEARALVGGDARCYSVAAASIVAKVTRDRAMRALDERYPGYGFARHKGYGTAEHVAAIRALGPAPIHRPTFLRKILLDQNA